MIVAIANSVPPKTLSGRHLMTAGGTQTGVKNRMQVVPGLTLSHSFLVPEPSWSYGFSSSTAGAFHGVMETKVQALEGHWGPPGLS